MRAKLATPEGKKVYGLRKITVEPVFGQIKGARGFRMFSLRGLANVTAEWDLVCLTHNLLKLFRRWTPGTQPPKPAPDGRAPESLPGFLASFFKTVQRWTLDWPDGSGPVPSVG